MLQSVLNTNFFKTLFTGGTGALLSLLVTSVLTEVFFTREHYFVAYLIGVVVGVAYAFYMFVRVVFKTRTHMGKRLVFFALYMGLLVVVQTVVVRYIVSVFGVDWYFLVIAGVVLALSVVNYGVYSKVIFNESLV